MPLFFHADVSVSSERQSKKLSSTTQKGAPYGKRYDYATMREAKKQVSDLLAEERVDGKPWSVRRDLQQMQEQMRVREFNQHQSRKKSKGWER